MKSIPRICNASTDMFKHNVKIEDYFDVRGMLKMKWTYEVVNEDTKSLRRKRQKILLSQKPLVKIKLNKLLAARVIVSIHALKGWTVILKKIRCQLNDDIWLNQNHIFGEIIP